MITSKFYTQISKFLKAKVSKYQATHKSLGLTLVEILIVLVIIGLVGGWLASKTFKAGDRAKYLMTEAQIKQVGQYIEQFQLRNNALPQSLAELSCQGGNIPNCIPLAKSDELKDAWKNDFQYSVADGGRSYKILSFGSDGKDGGSEYDGDLFGTGP
jgi:general secretion pathway protein G